MPAILDKILVPTGISFVGANADKIARFASILMRMTSIDLDRQRGYFIPFSYQFGTQIYGSAWDVVKRESIANYGHVFEWNPRYRNDPTGFPMSVRLTSAFRTGQACFYQIQSPRQRHKPSEWFHNLGPVGERLVRDFGRFYLPDESPVFDNYWQAFMWNMITSTQFYASRCEYGRFHSNFTSFKHRRQLRHKVGWELASIDVVSCQPLLLAALAEQAYGLTVDLMRWKQAATDGCLYELLAALIQKDRAATKLDLISCMFKMTARMKHMVIFQVIEQEFPTLARYLVAAKRNGYRELARRCQRLESMILIDGVAKSQEDVTMITIHDEIILPTKDMPKVRKSLSKHFGRHNIQPNFKVGSLA